MKKIVLLLIFTALLGSLSAQKSYIAINLGTSVPKDNFVATESLLTDGYAVSGFSIEFDGIYFPGSVFGVGGMLGFGSMYTNKDKYFDNLSDYLNSNPQLPGFTLPAEDDVSYTTGFWNYVNVLAGPELSAPIWKFQVGVRAMGGISLIVAPKRDLSYEGTLDSVTSSTSGTDVSLTYLYGGSLMYYLSPGTSLRIAADYFNTRANYNFKVAADTPVGTLDESVKETINLSALQLSVGLSYAF